MGFRHVSVMSQVSKKKMSRVRIVTTVVYRLASDRAVNCDKCRYQAYAAHSMAFARFVNLPSCPR